MLVLPKLIYRFNTISIRLPVAIFTEMKNWYSNSYKTASCNSSNWKSLEKEEQNWKAHTSLFQTYCEAVIIKTLCHWHDERHRDQIEMRVQNKPNQVLTRVSFPSSTKGAGTIRFPHVKRNETEPSSRTMCKINSKWINLCFPKHKAVSIRKDKVKILLS